MKINYLEIPTKHIPSTKAFFSAAFGWEFVDYGTDYSCFSNAGIQGGFFTSDKTVSTLTGSVLVVLYSEHLENTLVRVVDSGGKVVRSIFPFPGGRRFHFSDPNGNEFAVWSDK